MGRQQNPGLQEFRLGIRSQCSISALNPTASRPPGELSLLSCAPRQGGQRHRGQTLSLQLFAAQPALKPHAMVFILGPKSSDSCMLKALENPWASAAGRQGSEEISDEKKLSCSEQESILFHIRTLALPPCRPAALPPYRPAVLPLNLFTPSPSVEVCFSIERGQRRH